MSEDVDTIIQFAGKYNITIWRVLQLLKNYDNKKNIEENLVGSYYKIMVSVNQADIFSCNLFNPDDLLELSGEVGSCKSDELKIITYATFLKNNITCLLGEK